MRGRILLINLLVMVVSLSFGQTAIQLNEHFSSLNSYQHSANMVYNRDTSVTVFPSFYFQTHLILPYSQASMFTRDSENSKYFLDFTKMDKRSTKWRHMFADAEFKWLQVVTNFKGTVWSFSVEDRAYFTSGFEKKMFSFFNKGNKSFLNQSVEFEVPTSGMHFRSFELTWAKPLNQKIDFAITGKIYSGRSFLHINPVFSVFTQADAEYIDIGIQTEGRSSLPVCLANVDGLVSRMKSQFSSGDYLFGFQNPGLGFNLSINYHFQSNITFWGDLIDVGMIMWRKDINNLVLNKIYNWDGVDVSGVLNSSDGLFSFDGLTKFAVKDSLLNGLETDSPKPFITSVPTTFVVGASYDYSPVLRFECSNQLQFLRYNVRDLFSLSAGYKLREKWMLWSGLTLQNQSWFDIPVGFEYFGEKLLVEAKINNAWGLVLPGLNRNFGASFAIKYRFNFEFKPSKKYIDNSDEEYPFFDPYEGYDYQ